MTRRRAVWIGLLVLAIAAPAAAGDPVAARIGDETIALDQVDAATGGKAAALLQRLHALAEETLESLVDARIAASQPTPRFDPEPVSEADVSAFRAERAADFEGPTAPSGNARDPAVQRAAIRHYLEREAAQRARARSLAAARAGHVIERELPGPAQLATPLAPDRVIARVDGEPIRADRLEQSAALGLYRLRGELARERIRSVTALVEEQLLAREAGRRGTTVDAMLDAETRAPDDAAVEAYVARERAAGREASAERARPYLGFRARYEARERLLEAARSRSDVVILLEEPAPPRLPVESAGAPALGAADGARLVVFANYRCRACRSVHTELDRLLATSSDVRVAFRDFLPHYDPAARQAAALARCADRQGRFAALRHALLEAPDPGFGGVWDVDALAARAGLDAAALRSCSEGKPVQAAIDADTDAARRLGFDSAPAFVAEGIPLSGTQSAAGLARALRQGLPGAAN